MKNNTPEIGVSLILVVLLIVILNPFKIWMPTMLHLIMLACVLIVFSLFAVFILREKGGDEREMAHRMLAGRIGFLSGTLMLVVGIFIQSVHGAIDPWLITTLVVMILVKIGAREYSNNKL